MDELKWRLVDIAVNSALTWATIAFYIFVWIPLLFWLLFEVLL